MRKTTTLPAVYIRTYSVVEYKSTATGVKQKKIELAEHEFNTSKNEIAQAKHE